MPTGLYPGDTSHGSQFVGNQTVAISTPKASPQETLIHNFQTCNPDPVQASQSDAPVRRAYPCCLWALNQGLSSPGRIREAPFDLVKSRGKQTVSLWKTRNPWLSQWDIFPIGSEGLDLPHLLLGHLLQFTPAQDLSHRVTAGRWGGKKGILCLDRMSLPMVVLGLS